MQDRDYDNRRGYDQGRRGWDRGGEAGAEWGRWGGSGYDRGGHASGRDRERDEFMLQHRGYGGPGQQERGEGRDYGRPDDRGGDYGRGGFERSGDYRRRHDYGDDDFRREQDDRSEFRPGQGEMMYRPGLMRTSNHSDTEYEPRARGPMTERRGYWGQGGARGEEVAGYGRGATLGRDEDGGWDRPSNQGGELYRGSGFTREGRQIAPRQTGPFTGRGPRGYRRSDDRIQEEVCEVLFHHGEIDASEVEVRVENGEVTLTGTVQDRRQKRMIEDAIEELSGVKEVNNQLRVQQGVGQQGTWGQSDLARTGQTTIGATTGSATGATAGPGGEAERAGTNARNATHAR